MVIKPQKTKFQILIVENFQTISNWATNPWRKYSLALIIFFFGYLFGSSLGMVSAVFNFMDPLGALISVLIVEFLIRVRRTSILDKTKTVYILLTDFLRIGLLYGFFTEALKLL